MIVPRVRDADDGAVEVHPAIDTGEHGRAIGEALIGASVTSDTE